VHAFELVELLSPECFFHGTISSIQSRAVVLPLDFWSETSLVWPHAVDLFSSPLPWRTLNSQSSDPSLVRPGIPSPLSRPRFRTGKLVWAIERDLRLYFLAGFTPICFPPFRLLYISVPGSEAGYSGPYSSLTSSSHLFP